MSETQHTPGPWEFDGCVQIVESARPHMRVCFLPSDHHEYATSKPNGHLIAAAPEMLAAGTELDRLLLVIESAVRNSDPSRHAAVLAALKANRAAIAKATAALTER